MRKEARLLKERDFARVYKEGKVARTDKLVLYYLQTSEPGIRLGLSVGKLVGSAVERNRIKRLLREAFRLNETRLDGDCDLVVVARASLRASSFKQVEETLLDVLKKGKLVGGNESALGKTDQAL